MPNLTPSLKGDNYSQKQKKEMWACIHNDLKCPECGAEYTMLQGPRGGMAINIKCSKCKMVFWTTRYAGFGAYPISSNAPETGERR